jgi:hypothetical protein
MSRNLTTFFSVIAILTAFGLAEPLSAQTATLLQYRDTISDSGPGEQANHTISFTLPVAVSPGGYIDVIPPAGFEVLATSTFDVRNVELVVDGVPRVATTTASPGVDQVDITTGSPGLIRYTLAPDSGLSSGDAIELLIGNQTSNAFSFSETFSTSTGTTTVEADIEPIVNSDVLGRHDMRVEIYDGGLIASANPIIFLVEKVIMPGIDTTEEIPPFRFNGSPSSTVPGTTLNVEIGVETDEFADCRFDTVAGTDFFSMPNTFTNTGLVFHTSVVPVTPNSQQQFFVRCIDDEDNFNFDDYVISFFVNEIPTGESNTEGETDGDGTGTGDEGTGDGDGAGGTTGQSDGEEPQDGGDTGTGGSGGGGGGGSGGSSGSSAGGGFESQDAPFQSGDGRVIINGYAFPNSTVTVLVDGQIVDTTRADSGGDYSITIDEIARGVYTFGVYAAGPDDVDSSTFSTSFTVTGARTTVLSNINVAPSILVAPDPVNPGETLTVSGYALPNATIFIENGRNNSAITGQQQVLSDGNGRWSTTFDTTNFRTDTYRIRARAEQADGTETNFSEYTFYGVGQEADVPLNADLNRDGSVNLIDFSILLFWWNSDGGDSNPPADINRDARVNLTDFSILLFQWTG